MKLILVFCILLSSCASFKQGFTCVSRSEGVGCKSIKEVNEMVSNDYFIDKKDSVKVIYYGSEIKERIYVK